jgi:hypothetical protein
LESRRSTETSTFQKSRFGSGCVPFTESTRFLPDKLKHLHEVIEDKLDRSVDVTGAVRPQKGGSKVDADQAARGADGGEPLVGEISRMRAQAWAFVAPNFQRAFRDATENAVCCLACRREGSR